MAHIERPSRVLSPLRALRRLARGKWLAGDDAEAVARFREISASGLFDAAFYCDRYPDAMRDGESALWHFVRHGMVEDRLPSAHFDPEWYRNRYPDVAKAGHIPLLHYIRHGAAEGRRPKPGSTARSPALGVCASAVQPAQPREAAEPAGHAGAATKKAASVDAVGDFARFEQQCVFQPELRAPFPEWAIRAIGHMVARKRHRLRTGGASEVETAVSVVVPWLDEPVEAVRQTVEALLQSTHPVDEIVILMAAGTSGQTVAQRTAGHHAGLRWVGPAHDAAALVQLAAEAVRGPWVVWLAPGYRLGNHYMDVMRQAAAACPTASVLNCGSYEAARGAAASDQDHSSLNAVRLSPLQASWCAHSGTGELNGVMHDVALLRDLPRPDGGIPLVHVPWLVLVWLTQQAYGISVPCLLVERVWSRNGTRARDGVAEALPPQAVAATKGQCLADLLPASSFAELQRMYAPRAVPPCTAADSPTTVIIPSYECSEELRLCVTAVRAFSPATTRIIVIDNASGPATQTVLDEIEALENATVIRNAANLGFTHAVNQGLEQLAADSDIVLLNNDAVVTPGWLAALQEVRRLDPEVGLVVPQQVLLPHSPTMRTHNPHCSVARELDVNLSLHHDNILTPFYDAVPGAVALRFAPFFCVFIPRDVYDALGPLDHLNGPHYRSDNLYCEAVRRILNRPILHTSHSKVYHLLQRATKQLQSADAKLYEAMFRRNEWAGIVSHHEGEDDDR